MKALICLLASVLSCHLHGRWVKDSKVLILDEATASVDYETDRKIQDTITTEFHDRTILCIARTSDISFFFCT